MTKSARVVVKYYNLIREAVHTSSEIFEVDPALRWRDVIELLAERHGQAFRKAVMTDDGLWAAGVRIFVDGRALLPDGFDREVGSGGELSFFSAVSGG
jgi:molybdopterin converting factor small subunit